MFEKQPARVETEFSVAWIVNNGELFQKNYNKFFDDYASEYRITSLVRKGFLTLVADLIQ